MNNGGFGSLAKTVASYGRAGDTAVGMVTPGAQNFLSAMGGSGTTNPWTGMTEYAQQGNFDAQWYLDNNPDVKAAGVDAWEHYNSMGRTEGRVGNAQERAARDEGFTEEFGDNRYANWRQQQLQSNGYLDSSGNIRSDLTGGNVDVNAPGTLSVLAERAEARNRNYTGGWGSGGYGRFLENYSDADGDGVWTAPNSSNYDRAGNFVGDIRDDLRSLGFDDEFGDGASSAFWQKFLADNPSFSGNTADDAIRWQSQQESADKQASFQDQLEAYFSQMMEMLKPAPAPAMPDLSSILNGILGNNKNPTPTNVYGPAPGVSYAPNASGFGRMRAVFDPMTGKTVWVPDNTFGGFANALTGSTGGSSSANSGRRTGFGSLIQV